jgi:hypothetical protein
MADADQDAFNKTDIAGLTATISPERFNTYLIAAGHEPARALRLYMWNAQVGEAFHVPIQAVEVSLRNRANAALVAAFGPDWWQAQPFLDIANADRRDDLEVVRRRIKNRKLPLVTGQIVAGLSFGFWAGVLHGSYNPPVWGGLLRATFPNLPANRGRKSLHKSAGDIAFVRNRIWHHEPIFKRDLSKDYATVMEMLEWICPIKAQWVQPHCRVPELLMAKP